MSDPNIHQPNEEQRALHKEVCAALAKSAGKIDTFEALAILSQISAQLVLFLPLDMQATGIETIMMNVNLALENAERTGRLAGIETIGGVQ